MFLGELISKLEDTEFQIKELESFLHKVADKDVELVNQATERLLKLLDKHRSYSLVINQINNSTKISLDGEELTLASAIIIINDLGTKIRILNDIVSSENNLLDLFEIMDRRNKIMEEHTKLSNELRKLEWRIQFHDQESVG